ncbi:MAG: hypothetical protein HY779_00060 [Rubrobacteridae bacterium]|nr:hypothetical protein [Rubrobacteridae bacterium]
MPSVLKRFVNFAILIALTFLFFTQVLNVRSPMIIKTALASDAKPYVSGSVVVSGSTPGNVLITLIKSGGPTLTKYTNGGGYFIFSGLTPGNYTIKAYRSDVTPLQRDFILGPGMAATASIRLVTRYGYPPMYIYVTPFLY